MPHNKEHVHDIINIIERRKEKIPNKQPADSTNRDRLLQRGNSLQIQPGTGHIATHELRHLRQIAT
jgi:hypothetical protein